MYNRLFEPITIRNLSIPNRFVMPPMGTNYGDSAGFVTQRMIEYYRERAKNRVGLVFIEVTSIAVGGKSIGNEIAIHDDKFIPGLRKLAEAVKQAGARCFIQLHHAGRLAHPEYNDGMQPVAPSPIPARGSAMPREITIEEIEGIIKSFVSGAKRAKEAGFDGIELHFAHNYLISQFLSPLTNKRRDKYGGDLTSRARLLIEITERVREAVGDYPISARFGCEEFIKGGFNIKEAKGVAKMLEEAGVDVLNVTVGYTASHEEGYLNGSPTPAASMALPHGWFVHLTEEIKREVKIPVIAVGRLDDPDIASDIITKGKADLIAIGRGLIADPAYVTKLFDNKIDEIRRCIACRRCLITMFCDFNMRCTVNPEVGREEAYYIKPTKKVKQVLVVGGGPAGMEAARVAALRGHRVMLMEKKSNLGGNLISAAGVTFKRDVNYVTGYLSTAILHAGVDVKLNTTATLEKILATKSDVVILATGSIPIIPDIPGMKLNNVVTAVDVLEGKAKVGDSVIVAGGGEVGCEAAVYLTEKGKKVTIVEMRDTDWSDTEGLAPGMDDDMRRWFIADLLPTLPINVIGKVTFKEITNEGMVVTDREGKNQLVKGNTIVLAAGMKANNSLKVKLVGKVPEIYEVGDCITARKIIDATTEGAQVARLI